MKTKTIFPKALQGHKNITMEREPIVKEKPQKKPCKGLKNIIMGPKPIAYGLCLIAASILSINGYSQNVGISPTGVVPDNSAGLDVNFTNKGLLIPRVALTSATDALTIPSPATSLLVYNTGTGGLTPAGYYYNAGTTSAPNWVRLLPATGTGGAWLINGNAGTTAGTHFVGTTDAQDLVFKTNNTERMRILQSNGNIGVNITNPYEKLSIYGGIRLHSERGIGFNSEFAYDTLCTGDRARIYYVNTGTIVPGITNPANDFLIIEKTDVNDVNPDGGIVFLNQGSTNVKSVALAIRGNGFVGVATSTPAQRLDVVGNIQFSGDLRPSGVPGTSGQVLVSQGAGNAPIWSSAVSGMLAGAWEVSPTTNAISINSTTWTNTDVTLTFNLTKPCTVYMLYSINVQPNASPGGDYVMTRLNIDGTPDRTTASHFQPYCNGDCNVNLNGTKVMTMAAGLHTVTLQWRTWNGTLTWSNDPNWCDGFCGARKLVVLAYYQ